MNTKYIPTLFANLRPPQMLFHLGALLLGVSISKQLVGATAVATIPLGDGALACGAVVVGWCAALFSNDYFDQNIDQRTNRERFIVQGDMQPHTVITLAIVCAVVSLGFAAAVGQMFFVVMGFYHIIAFVYNVPPLRMKRIPLVATFLIALSLQMIVFAGFVLHQKNATLSTYPFSMENIVLSLFFLALFVTLKDLKDVEGDKADNVLTLPHVFGRRATRLIGAGGLSGFFFLSAIEQGGTSILWLPLTASVLTVALYCTKQFTFVTDRTVLWWALIPVFYFGSLLHVMIF